MFFVFVLFFFGGGVCVCVCVNERVGVPSVSVIAYTKAVTGKQILWVAVHQIHF